MSRTNQRPVIIVSGSSSGGHVTPINPVAREIKKMSKDARLLFVGQRGDSFAKLIDKKLVPKKRLIFSGKFRWYHDQGLRQLLDIKTLLLNLRDFFLVIVGIFQSYYLLSRTRPTTIFIKGGSIAVPLGLVAALRKVPIVTHDSDNKPGRGSKFLSRWVVVHTVGMDSDSYGFDVEDTVHVGVPIDDAFFKEVSQKSLKKVADKYGVDSSRKSILVIGGSQGAGKLNRIIDNSLGQLLKVADVIHVVGKVGMQGHQNTDKKGYHAIEFIKHEEVPAYFHQVDLIISRAGATYLTEVAAVGKPVIIIPGKQLSGGHQITNSDYFTQKGAGIGLDEDELLVDNKKFVESALKLLSDNEAAKKMVSSQVKLRKRDSATQIAKVIIETARRYEKTKK